MIKENPMCKTCPDVHCIISTFFKKVPIFINFFFQNTSYYDNLWSDNYDNLKYHISFLLEMKWILCQVQGICILHFCIFASLHLQNMISARVNGQI